MSVSGKLLHLIAPNSFCKFLLLNLVVAAPFMVLPGPVSAAVIINEIAWMGDSESANNEWIELFNTDTSDRSLDGWTLGDGVNLTIDLSGVLPGSGYAVLERTDDDSAPGKAFLLYTGALTNTGATLTLRNGSGSIEDQVAGGEDWKNVGGDNASKETAQFTEGGWVTAPATPGRVNASQTPAEELEEDDAKEPAHKSEKSESKSGNNKVVQLELPDVELSLDIRAPEIVYVNQPFKLGVDSGGLGESIMESLRYEWNFGDSNQASGQDTRHVYKYPGQYVVVVYGHYARHEQTARHKITVLPVNFSITRTKAGDIQIHNDSKYEIDLSGYRLAGEQDLTLPPRTIILPGATLTISRDKLNVTLADAVELYDQAGSLVAAHLFKVGSLMSESSEVLSQVSQARAAEPNVNQTVTLGSVSAGNSNFEFKSDLSGTKEVENELPKTVADQPGDESVTTVTQPKDNPENMIPYLGLAAVILAGLLGAYLKPSRQIEKSGE